MYAERYPEHEGAARGNRALCLLNDGEPEKGLAEARRAYNLSPHRANHTIVLEALAATDYIEELECEAKAHVESYPEDFLGWSALGRAALGKGNLTEAMEHFRKTVELEPKMNFAWGRLGHIYLKIRFYEKALDAFGKAQASAHTRPAEREKVKFEALMGMGWSLLLLEMPERAQILANQAEVLNVSAAEVQGLKARCLLAMDEPNGLSTGETALHLGFRDDYLRVRMAFEYAALGRDPEAKKIIESLAPHSDDLATRQLMVGTLLWLGRTKEAIEELEALDGKLEPHIRLNSLAGAYRVAGDFGKSEESSLRAMDLRRDEVTLTNLAVLYVEQEWFEDAEPLLKEALKFNPDFSEAKYLLGYCYAALDKEGLARKHLQRVVRSDSARSSRKASAADLLGRLAKGREIVDHQKRAGLIVVSHKDYERLHKRSERQDTLKYEDECARLVGDPKGSKGLRWEKVKPRKFVSHAKKTREVDVYGVRENDDVTSLLLGECKLKTSNTVSYSDMRELVEKMALVACWERHDQRRAVEGYFFANVVYDEDAKVLANRHGIRMFLAHPQKGWKKRADWRLGKVREEAQ